MALEGVKWTDDTTRATALTNLNGYKHKAGDTTRKYIGTIRKGGYTSITVPDLPSYRFVYNEYNRVKKRLLAYDTGASTWTYNSTDVHALPSSIFYFVTGLLKGTGFKVDLALHASVDTDSAVFGFGVDSTSTMQNSGRIYAANTAPARLYSTCSVSIATPGYHYITGLEQCVGSATITGIRNTYYGPTIAAEIEC